MFLHYCFKYVLHFRELGASPTHPRNPVEDFWLRAWSNHVFALLISMPPEFSLMPRFKSISFFNVSLKLSYLKKKFFFKFWGRSSQTHETVPSPIAYLWLRA